MTSIVQDGIPVSLIAFKNSQINAEIPVLSLVHNQTILPITKYTNNQLSGLAYRLSIFNGLLQKKTFLMEPFCPAQRTKENI